MGKDKAKKENKKSIGKIVLITIMIIIFALGAYLGYLIQINGGGLQGLLATLLGQDAETLRDLDTINVLVLRCK